MGKISSLPILRRSIDQVDPSSFPDGRAFLCPPVQGDPLAKEKLIQSNVKFVVKVTKDFHGLSLPLEDLASEVRKTSGS